METTKIEKSAAELNQVLLDNLPCVAMLVKKDTMEVVACNEMARASGVETGRACYEKWKSFDAPCPWCLAPEVWRSGEGRNLVVEFKGETLDTYWVPMGDEYYLHYAFDITMKYEFQRNLEKLTEREKKLSLLSRKIIELQEEERAVLARELHDDMAQRLTALSIELDLLQGVTEGDTQLQLKRIFEYTNETIKNLRMLCRSLRPMMIDDIGLGAALRTLLRDFEKRSGLTVESSISADDTTGVCRKNNMNIYRIVQEALNNILRHADATRIEFSYVTAGGKSYIKIKDNGRGYVPGADEKAGIISMRERAAMAGGEIEFKSESGEGAEVILRFPTSGGGQDD